MAKPSKRSLEFLDWEFGIFFHFGIRTFYRGHKDWDNRPMPAEGFNPTDLDCESWILTAKEAGARYCLLTTKHHDGFALWPSKYTDYSVAHTPWKDGKGDVVREYVDACRKHDMKVGLYYSPAQWGGTVSFAEEKAYDDYFINQISELLTNYGEIDYLWFDGCGSEKHTYDKVRIIGAIRSLQPNIRIFDMWDPDTRWVGNEDGYCPLPNLYTVDSVPLSVNATEGHAIGEPKFLPPECDTKMRDSWFDDDNVETMRTAAELVGEYESSVGHGANYLLNIGPDRSGHLPEPDVKVLKEFADEIKRRYDSPLPFGAPKTEGNRTSIETPDGQAGWIQSPVGTKLVDTVEICEDITNGGAVRSFRLIARMPYCGRECCIFESSTIGHKRICRFPAVLTSKLTLEITEADGEATITSMKAFYVAK